jgi:hypothetical protein
MPDHKPGCTTGSTELFKESDKTLKNSITDREKITKSRQAARRVNPCDLPRALRARLGFNVR